MLLLPALERSTIANGVKARVVNTTSSAHVYAAGDGMLWEAFKGGPKRDAKIKEWGTSRIPGSGAQWHLYGLSKMVIPRSPINSRALLSDMRPGKHHVQ